MKAKFFLLVLTVLFFTGIHQANAQYLKDALGRQIILAPYENVEGDAYLFKDWQVADVKLNTGDVYKNVQLKYDQLKETLYFKGDKNEEVMAFAVPVREFTINGTADTPPLHYRNGYHAIPGVSANAYFEVLANGTTQLLKRTAKNIQEEKGYGEAAVTKKIVSTVKYYLVLSDKTIQIKNDKKSLLAALSNKHPEIEKYIQDNHLNLKNDTDLGKVVTYYNSI